MLKVNISDLTFNCIIGILPSERKDEQKVIVDISFEYFYDDKISNFIDYSEVANLIQQIMIEKKFKLIEDAILYIRKDIKLKYNIKNLRVKITKPDILSNCIVSIEE